VGHIITIEVSRIDEINLRCCKAELKDPKHNDDTVIAVVQMLKIRQKEMKKRA
jgi:hypothetical protein